MKCQNCGKPSYQQFCPVCFKKAKRCIICGKMFIPEQPHHQFCSDCLNPIELVPLDLVIDKAAYIDRKWSEALQIVIGADGFGDKDLQEARIFSKNGKFVAALVSIKRATVRASYGDAVKKLERDTSDAVRKVLEKAQQLYFNGKIVSARQVLEAYYEANKERLKEAEIAVAVPKLLQRFAKPEESDHRQVASKSELAKRQNRLVAERVLSSATA